MNAAPLHPLTQVSSSHRTHRSKAVQHLSKSNEDFRQASRKQDAHNLMRAFDGPTQAAIAERGSRALGVSPRQIIYWMQCQNDMPSWAVKAVDHYLGRVERIARKIEGQE